VPTVPCGTWYTFLMQPNPIRRNIKLLYLFNFFEDFRLYAPIAIIFFSEVAGSYALGMTVFSVIFITQTVFELPMGVVSDYIGRKKTIIAGAVCGVTSIALYASGFGFTLLLLGAVFEGLARTFFSGNNSALLYETLKQLGEEERFADVSGKSTSMFQLALAISALLGSIVVIYFPLIILFSLTIIPQILSLITSFFFVEPTIHTEKVKNNPYHHVREAIVTCYQNKELRLLTLSNAFSQGIGEVLHQFRPAFIALLWPAWAIGIYRAFTNASGFFGFYFSGLVIKTLSPIRSLLIVSGLGNAIQILALLLSNVLSPIIMALPSLTYGTERTAMETLQQQRFTDSQRATMGSLSGLLAGIIFAIAAFLFGWLADVYGLINALLAGQVFMLFALYLNYLLYKRSV